MIDSAPSSDSLPPTLSSPYSFLNFQNTSTYSPSPIFYPFRSFLFPSNDLRASPSFFLSPRSSYVQSSIVPSNSSLSFVLPITTYLLCLLFLLYYYIFYITIAHYASYRENLPITTASVEDFSYSNADLQNFFKLYDVDVHHLSSLQLKHRVANLASNYLDFSYYSMRFPASRPLANPNEYSLPRSYMLKLFVFIYYIKLCL
jgi:hypothetical protein